MLEDDCLQCSIILTHVNVLPPRPIRKSQTHQRQALPPKVEDEDFDFEADFGAATGGMTVKSDREKAEAETAAAAAAATAAAAGGGAAGDGAAGAAGAGALATE